MDTLPETNIAHENPMFPCKYHQKGGCSMAMLVLGRVPKKMGIGKGISFQIWLVWYLFVRFQGACLDIKIHKFS